MGELDVLVMILNSALHWSSSLAYENFTAFTYDSGLPREQITKAARIEMCQSQLLKINQSQQSILLIR